MTTAEDSVGKFMSSMDGMAKGGVRTWDVFQNFCNLTYHAILAQGGSSNMQDRAKSEASYMKLVKKIGKKQTRELSEMLSHVANSLDQGLCDVLGQIYMDAGFSNMKGGQVFTPWPICQLMAKSTISLEVSKPVYLLMEPACGSGALVLAAADVIDSNKPFSECLWADATDSDVICQRMAYIQMSLVGVPGVVRHGDSLANEYHENAVTPAGVALYHSSMYLRLRLSGKRSRKKRHKASAANPTRSR